MTNFSTWRTAILNAKTIPDLAQIGHEIAVYQKQSDFLDPKKMGESQLAPLRKMFAERMKILKSKRKE